MRIKLSKYAKLNGISYMSAYRYFHSGLIKGVQLDTGTILIDLDEENKKNTENNRVVLYTRVSSSENKSNLDSQLERLRLYAYAKGYNIINECNTYKQLIDIIKTDDWDIVIIENKEILPNYELINVILNKLNKKIEVLNIS